MSKNREEQLGLGYLRATMTFVVVLYHVFLAYCVMAVWDKSHIDDAFNPIVDQQRWVGFDIWVIFHDTYFMALMFFIAGLFTYQGLAGRGFGDYIKSRFMRLGIPFIIVVASIMPLAYYISYLTLDAVPSYGAYLISNIEKNIWKPGPPWFIAVLFLFDLIAAILYVVISRIAVLQQKKPLNGGHFFIPLALLSICSYVPATLYYGPSDWGYAGPFMIQLSRIGHYFVYFIAGLYLGRFGFERTFLSPNSTFSKNWLKLFFASILFFVMYMLTRIPEMQVSYTNTSLFWKITSSIFFCITCCINVAMCLAVYLRIPFKKWFIFESFKKNAYGIYLIHFLPTIYFQYLFLSFKWNAIEKAFVVGMLTMGVSWVTTALLRRSLRLRRYLG